MSVTGGNKKKKRSKQDTHERSPASGWRQKIPGPPPGRDTSRAALRSSKELGYIRETESGNP